jgi:glycosyltransferase involved in cell wall biosynthesis
VVVHQFMTDEAEPHAPWAPLHCVSFVLPAFNEEPNIARAIETVISVASRHCAEYEVIVVDDGSKDATAQLVDEYARQDAHVRLVQHATNRGYGEALRTGFTAAELDYVFFTDADNQFDMNEFPLLLRWANDADVVAGFRRQRQDPLVRRVNAWGWNRLVRMLFYVPVRDIDCAFKLFRREALVDLDIQSRGAMINTEIMVKLARAGRSVVEVGVTHLPRTAGEPSGANLRVVTRAFREVYRMYPVLSTLSETTRGRTPPAGHDQGHGGTVGIDELDDVSRARGVIQNVDTYAASQSP